MRAMLKAALILPRRWLGMNITVTGRVNEGALKGFQGPSAQRQLLSSRLVRNRCVYPEGASMQHPGTLLALMALDEPLQCRAAA